MSKRLAAIFLRNIWYKLTAIILAALFWYIVQGEEVLEINRRINVTFDIPRGLMIKGSTVRTKDVTLRGPRVLLGDFPSKALEATIRIPEGRSGALRFRLDKEHFHLWDSRIKLTVHDPYLVAVVEERFERKVVVKEVLKGVPADGFMVEKVIIEPDVIVVAGPKSDVLKLKEVVTEPIDISGIQANKNLQIALSKPQNGDLALAAEVVQVKIAVGEQKINKKYMSVPIDIQSENMTVVIHPPTANVEIQGTEGVLAFVKRSDLKAFVDTRDLGPGRHEVEIQVKIPSETTLIEIMPGKAAVEVGNQRKLH